MKIRFKTQEHQTTAVDSIVNCFVGQPHSEGAVYRIDSGSELQTIAFLNEGFKNADLELTEQQLLENINRVQRQHHLHVSESLTSFTTLKSQGQRGLTNSAYKKNALKATRVHLDVEMETGTGKTYCYIKTIFEMNKRYGWSKFIVVVPSIAIREGVTNSFRITANHFAEDYGKKARFFVYSSKQLHEVESFSIDSGINVMIINIQAFNSKSAENRRIYEQLDSFQSRKPIDVIASNRPILILDEPQKMEGGATMEALSKFRSLMILRYSATHRTLHNCVYRLDALDAYNQKLVKKISVKGIEIRGLYGSNAYLYLDSIDLTKNKPTAQLEFEVKQKSGKVRRQLRRVKQGDNLFVKSNHLNQYQNYTISSINYIQAKVEFTNGIIIRLGEAYGDMSELQIRRIQIRETIKSHIEKEMQIFSKGIKVLSLFFIDAVVKYRDYTRNDEKGEYARIFEEEYEAVVSDYLTRIPRDQETYRKHLKTADTAKVHNGYFSIDKKNRLKDPIVKGKSVDSDDTSAYELILKDKEQLLSLNEPTRFIFSHSALREGWDNPNIFCICILKYSDSNISRRQEVGRGLRLSVNQSGIRMDDKTSVHDINLLTVVANESYSEFVSNLQQEISVNLSTRTLEISESRFIGLIVDSELGPPINITSNIARIIHRHLIRSEYIDDFNMISQQYRDSRVAYTLANFPGDLAQYSESIFRIIDSFIDDRTPIKIENGYHLRPNPLNENFKRKEFRDLWSRINQKATYRVKFDSSELVLNCVSALSSLHVTPLQYKVQSGVQEDSITLEQLTIRDSFTTTGTYIDQAKLAQSDVKYDLVGNIANNTQLTRQTVADILSKVSGTVFSQFKQNPEHFIAEASRLISEQWGVLALGHNSHL